MTAIPSLYQQLEAAVRYKKKSKEETSMRAKLRNARLHETFKAIVQSGKNLTMRQVIELTGFSYPTTHAHVQILVKQELIVSWKIKHNNFDVVIVSSTDKGREYYRDGSAPEWE